MTTDEHQERKIIQIDIAVLHGQYDYDVCGSYQCICKQIESGLVDWFWINNFYYSTIVIIGCSITFHLAKKAIQKTIKAPLLHFFCYFSIGDIVCDPAVYGLWSDSARWIISRKRVRLQLPFFMLWP
jgi:hypothetical protein